MSMNSFHSRGRRPAPAPRTESEASPAHPGLARADALLVARGLLASRTRAQEAIADGRVRVDGLAVTKPSQLFPQDARIELTPDASGHS